jgi:hypothetical protein
MPAPPACCLMSSSTRARPLGQTHPLFLTAHRPLPTTSTHGWWLSYLINLCLSAHTGWFQFCSCHISRTAHTWSMNRVRGVQSSEAQGSAVDRIHASS